MPDFVPTELAAKLEKLFVERKKPDHLDESFVKELFDNIPIAADEKQHIDRRSSNSELKFVSVQAVFGGSVYPPALEKIIVFDEEKEFITPNDRNQSVHRFEATAEVSGYLEGAATYKIRLVGFEISQNEVFGYVEVYNESGSLRFIHRGGLVQGGAGRGVWKPLRI